MDLQEFNVTEHPINTTGLLRTNPELRPQAC